MLTHRLVTLIFIAAVAGSVHKLSAQPEAVEAAAAMVPQQDIVFPNTQPHRFDAAEEDAHWRLTVMPYLWAASLKGDVTVKGVTSEVDASFADIFKGLDYAFIGQAELQRGRFFIIPDTVLLKLSEDVAISGNKTGKFGLVNVSGKVSASAEMLTYFQELVAGYRIYDRRRSDGYVAGNLSFDVLGGARYYYVSSEVTAQAKVKVTGPGGGTITRKRSGSISGSEDWIDPIVGARLKYDVSEKLALSLRGDVGGFGVGSDLAWNATALADYRLNECWKLFGGYRVLDIDYSNGERGMNARMAGPIIGAQYKFDF